MARITRKCSYFDYTNRLWTLVQPRIPGIIPQFAHRNIALRACLAFATVGVDCLDKRNYRYHTGRDLPDKLYRPSSTDIWS